MRAKDELRKAHWEIGTESQKQEMPKYSSTHKAYVLKKDVKDPNSHDSEFVKVFKDRASGSLSRLEREGYASLVQRLSTGPNEPNKLNNVSPSP